MINYMDSNFVYLFYIELIISITGFSLFIIELRALSNSLRNPGKNRSIVLSLLGILFFSNFIYLMRTIGIYTDNLTIRQLGAAFSVLVTELFLINWGSFATNISDHRRNTLSFGIVLGAILFATGTFIQNIVLIIFGVLFFAALPVGMLFWLFMYVFGKSPYIFAKQRIFLMSSSLAMIIILEGIAVAALEAHHYTISNIIFTFELPIRVLMTMSILLPRKIQDILSIIIK